MCPPTHFAVTYSINPWMDTSVPVDQKRALEQWAALKAAYERHGHSVYLLDPQAELPDMVYTANGGVSIDGVVFGARFAHWQRAAEAEAHSEWYRQHGWADVVPSKHINEGEGDFVYLRGRDVILAGYGFRTEPAAHAEAAEVLKRPIVSLKLVDNRFYHLDVALFALDDSTICYYPGAFSPSSQEILRRLFPEAVIASQEDALVFGLNALSDGHHVFMAAEAEILAATLAERGYTPIPINLSELRKGGGSVKCCTAELRKAGDE